MCPFSFTYSFNKDLLTTCYFVYEIMLDAMGNTRKDIIWFLFLYYVQSNWSDLCDVMTL